MKKTFRFLFMASAAMFAASCCNAPQEESKPEVKVVLPGEQAPLADPGQKSFGGLINPGDTAGQAARRRARMAEMNKIRTIHFNDLTMSDPFIIPDPETQTYYLTSSGGRLYKSKDLVWWEGPYNVIDIEGTWLKTGGGPAASEIHKIGDYYYYAGTWNDHNDLIQQVPRRYNVPHNQTYLLRSKTHTSIWIETVNFSSEIRRLRKQKTMHRIKELIIYIMGAKTTSMNPAPRFTVLSTI